MTSRTWTIREVLEWATQDFAGRGIESPRLDAELLVAKALETDRVGLYLDLNRPLVHQERSAIRPLVAAAPGSVSRWRTSWDTGTFTVGVSR